MFQPTKVWGDKVLATDRTYDYTLFTVENFAPVQKFGYLTLDTVRPGRGQELYVPQHPAGEPTRIAGRAGRAGGQLRGRRPRLRRVRHGLRRLVLLRHRGRLVRLAGAVPQDQQGGRPAPLRRLPELRRPRPTCSTAKLQAYL